MSGRNADRGGRGGRGGGGRGGRGRGETTLPYHGGRGGGGGDRGGGGGFRGGRPQQAVEVFSHGPNDTATPDKKVQKIEDEAAGNIKKKMASDASKASLVKLFPPRPAYGTRGKGVTLWANYFELVADGGLQLFRYQVELQAGAGDRAGDREPAGRKLRRIFELLLEDHFAAYRNDIATDFKAFLICKRKLSITQEPYRVVYRSEGEDEPGERAKTFQLRVVQAGTLSSVNLTEYLSSTSASGMLQSKDEFLQALNIIMGHHPKTDPRTFSIGANKHFDMAPPQHETMTLGAGLMAMRGFFVSVRAAASRLLVNVQVKNTACFSHGPLLQLLNLFGETNGYDRQKLSNFVKKLRIQATHIIKINKAGKTIPRVKTISGLATTQDGRNLEHPPKVTGNGAGSRDVQFYLEGSPAAPGDKKQAASKKSDKKGGSQKKENQPPKAGPEAADPKPAGQYISVYDFFKQTYNIDTNPKIPVVNVGNRDNPSYLPVETANMIRFAVRKPMQNAQSIVTNGSRLLGVQAPHNATLTSFGISVTPKLIAVQGRVLTGPDVKYKGNVSARTNFGSWNMSQIKFSTSNALKSWAYLWIRSSRGQDSWRTAQDLQRGTLTEFAQELVKLGINTPACGNQNKEIVAGSRTFDADLMSAVGSFVTGPQKPAMVLVILPDNDAAVYSRVKYLFDIKAGIRNVCVLGSKFCKSPNLQYFANVGLKFNLKLGGRNQSLDPSKLGIIGEKKTMVVGLDVTHPSPGSASSAPSVAGIVASVDEFLGQWPADLRVQTARQEMIDGLQEMFRSRLRLWRAHNKTLPENILIYRDGVSEGQYQIVLDKELPYIRAACRETYPATDTSRGLPRLSIIIVGKRHNTRFYASKTTDADRSSNPQNGTVVDRGVTEVRNWDFFLQAHTALQGTARPAHYYIILDEVLAGRKPSPAQQAQGILNAADALEDLNHNMCYLFGRATKAVSIVPPAYYADLVCERARCYLSRVFDATPAGSVAGSEGAAAAAAALDQMSGDVKVHENVKDTMFYI